MSSCDIPWNYSWVIPNVLAATSCPESVKQLEFLKKEGKTNRIIHFKLFILSKN